MNHATAPLEAIEKALGSPDRSQARCACPQWADRIRCVDLRVTGYAPSPNCALERDLREECGCVCHDEQDQADRDAEDAEGAE